MDYIIHIGQVFAYWIKYLYYFVTLPGWLFIAFVGLAMLFRKSAEQEIAAAKLRKSKCDKTEKAGNCSALECNEKRSECQEKGSFRSFLSVTMVLCSVIALCAAGAVATIGPRRNNLDSIAYPSKAQILKEKIFALTRLGERLEEKQEEIKETDADFQKSISELKAEIQNELRASSISTLEEALRNKRIKSNLGIIRRQLAYSEKLREIAYQLGSGTIEIRHLKMEAETDLSMARILEDKDELVKKISQAIKDYQPYAEDFVLEKAILNLRSPESILRDIISGKI